MFVTSLDTWDCRLKPAALVIAFAQHRLWSVRLTLLQEEERCQRVSMRRHSQDAPGL